MLEPRTTRTARMTALALALAAALTACSSGTTEPSAEPSASTPDASPGASAPAQDEPQATPSETPQPVPSVDPVNAQPVTLGCNDLITLEAMYAYNPNFTLDADYSPAPSTLAAEIDGLQGLTCSWVNNTSGETIDVSVARLGADDIDELGNSLVNSSNSVPTYGTEGYFEVTGGVGTAQALAGEYWLVAQSVVFGEPGGATEVVEAALSQLP